MQMILFIIFGVAITLGFNKLSGFIKKNFVKGAIKAVKSDKENTNSSIGRVLNKDGEETFSWTKFKKAFKLNSLVEWVKDFLSMFNLRKIIIILAILGTVNAHGYWKGNQNVPIKVNLDYAKEFRMKITDNEFLVKPKNSQNLRIEDKKGKLIKELKAKDFPMLSKKLRPIGFILEPVAIVGYGSSIDKGKRGFEGGAGISFVKMWKWKLDTFLTNRGIYLGTSYSITERSGAGVAIGKGFDSSSRIMVYYRLRF